LPEGIRKPASLACARVHTHKFWRPQVEAAREKVVPLPPLRTGAAGASGAKRKKKKAVRRKGGAASASRGDREAAGEPQPQPSEPPQQGEADAVSGGATMVTTSQEPPAREGEGEEDGGDIDEKASALQADFDEMAHLLGAEDRLELQAQLDALTQS
jgi:hypothetical protein